MNKRIAALACGAFLATSGYAAADCEHLGNYYPVGSVICWNGWLQECTVADYWSAIGNCKTDGVRKDVTACAKPEHRIIELRDGDVEPKPVQACASSGRELNG